MNETTSKDINIMLTNIGIILLVIHFLFIIYLLEVALVDNVIDSSLILIDFKVLFLTSKFVPQVVIQILLNHLILVNLTHFVLIVSIILDF